MFWGRAATGFRQSPAAGFLGAEAPKRRFGSFAAGGKGTAGPGRGAPGLSIESIGVNAAQWVVCPAEKIVNRAV